MAATADQAGSQFERFFATAGLDPVSLAVYTFLMDASSGSEPDIAQALKLDLADIRAAVDSLVDSGFVRVTLDEQRIVAILQPDAGMATTISAAEARAAEELARLSSLRSLAIDLTEVIAEVRGRGDRASFERLDDTASIVSRLHELNHHVQEGIVTCVPTRPTREVLKAARIADESLLRRGIKVRGIYLDSCRNDPATMDYLHWMNNHGARVKLAMTIPARIQIFDQHTAVVAEYAQDSQSSAIIVHSPGIIHALLRLFEYMWDDASEPFEHDLSRSGTITSQQLEVVRLLARGAKDDAVARQLSVSPRTVRRAIADLSERLGTDSRFELGVRCAQLGWTGLDLEGMPEASDIFSSQHP